MIEFKKLETTQEHPTKKVDLMKTYLLGELCNQFRDDINALFTPSFGGEEESISPIRKMETLIKKYLDKLKENPAFIKDEEKLQTFAHFVYDKFMSDSIFLTEEKAYNKNVANKLISENNDIDEKWKKEFYDFFVDLALKYKDRNGEGILTN